MTHEPSYDELTEALQETRRDLAALPRECQRFAERLLCWLRDGNDRTDVGLATTVADGEPMAWWQPDDVGVASLVLAFVAAEHDAAVAAAERQSSRDR